MICWYVNMIYRRIKLKFNLNKMQPMKKMDLKNVKLPLSKKSFILLRKSIRTKQVNWLDMSRDLMFAYLDFWKSEKYKSMNEIVQD